MTVGERIAARRKELNMTQEELAKKLGYKSKSSINKIELKWANVPLSKLEKVAAALDCDPGYLMGWEDQQEQKPPAENDEELNEYLEDLRDRPELRMLFSLTRNVSKQDVEAAVRIIEALRGHQSFSDD